MPRGPDKTLDALLLFRDAPADGLGVTDLAEKLGLYKSMAHRILASLEVRGLVRQEPRGKRYLPGYALLALAGRFLSSTPLVQAALPALARLEAECGAPAALYVADGPEQVCLCATGTAASALGERRPLLPGAVGLALLAHMDAVGRAGLMGALASRVEFDPQALAPELEAVRRQGWASAAGATAAAVVRQRQLLGAVAVLSADAQRCAAPVAAAAQTVKL